MLESLTQATARYFVKNGVITQEDAEVHAYGWEGIDSSIAMYAVVFIIGLAMRRFWESAVWLTGFVLLRVYAGGYHASSHGCCLLTSCLIWLATALMIPYVSLPIMAVMLLFAMIMVWSCASAGHPLNPCHTKSHELSSNIAGTV